MIGEHHFDDIISEKNKLNNFVKKKIKFKKKSLNLKKSKLIQEKNISKGISWKNNDFKKFEILRFLVVEEQSFSQESLFNFILKNGNECNMDIATDGNIILEKYKDMFKRRMLYDFIFYDVNQNIVKGLDALEKIRKIEEESGIHTKIIGIQNLGNKNDSNININNNYSDKKIFDEVIPKSMKDFIELIYK